MTARHWTEDELIARLYGAGPEDHHEETCAGCAARLHALEEARSSGQAHTNIAEPDFEFLAAQRRKIYQRISDASGSWSIWRFAPALAMSLVLALGLLFFNQRQHSNQPVEGVKQTDTQLVEYVGGAAMNPEPDAVAPLQGLFEE